MTNSEIEALIDLMVRRKVLTMKVSGIELVLSPLALAAPEPAAVSAPMSASGADPLAASEPAEDMPRTAEEWLYWSSPLGPPTTTAKATEPEPA